jgi:hypothetical protein
MTAMRPESAAVPLTARFALIAVDGVEYAVDASWVRRSLPAPRPLPPAVPHGGAAFKVIDLRQLFGLPAGAPLPGAAGPGPERLMLLVEQPPTGEGTGGDAGRVALVVDGLLGIEPLDPGAAQPLPAVYRGPERAWFRGLVPRPGGRVAVLLRPAGLAAAAPGGNGC